MIDYTSCNIEQVAVHQIGNKTNDEDLKLSKSPLDISESGIKELLLKFFLSSFGSPEFNSFTFTNEDFTLNPAYIFATNIFDSSKTFHRNTVNFAKHLYEISYNSQIKSGDLFVVSFSNISLDGQAVNAIGLFKSENRQSFLKLDNNKEDFSIECEDGINIEKLDKGCMIFNTDKQEGYKVAIIDKSNKSEAQYWKDHFLQISPCNDDYHQTKEFLNITKNFVTKQLSEEFEVTKADQIDLLNRSVEYFKKNETFDKKHFEKEVFQDTGIIKSFRNFDEVYRDENEIEDLPDNFEISAQAVNKQAGIFKSVLKLDKNFHIYIHGDKELIEQGVDKDGRKFYKIYYKEEN